MTPPHTLPAPLGTLVYRAGLAAEGDVQDALAFAERHGRRLGEVLMQRGLVNERDLTNLLATQRGLASVSLAEQTVDPVAAALLSEDECRMHLAIPFRFQDDRVVLAIADPTNDSTFEELATVGGREAVFVVASRSDIYAAIDAHYGRRARSTNGSSPTVPQAPAPAAAVPTLAPAAAVTPAEESPARPAPELVVPAAAQDATRPPVIDAAPATPAAPGMDGDALRVAPEPQIGATPPHDAPAAPEPQIEAAPSNEAPAAPEPQIGAAPSNEAPAAPAKDVPSAPAPEPRAEHQQEILGRPEPETPVIVDSEAQPAIEAFAPESREPAAAEKLAEPEPEPEPEPTAAPVPGPAPAAAQAAPAPVAPLVADAPTADRAERSAEVDRDVRFRHVDLRVSEPRAPEEARPAPAPPAAPDGGADPRRFRVVLHLEGGESLDVETFDDESDAFGAADQLADELADRRGWPRIGRLLIPAARIVALEVQEVPTRGSGSRRRGGASGSARDDAL